MTTIKETLENDYYVLESWDEYAPKLLAALQSQFVELRHCTLEQFKRECPYKFAFVSPKAVK